MASWIESGLGVMSHRFRSRLVRAVIAVVVGVSALTAPEARAQFGGMMGSGMEVDASVTKRGLDAYAKILGLDADQKEAARELLNGNKAANKTMREEFQAKMKALTEKAQENQDWSVFQKEMPALGKEMGEKVEKVEKSFFDDLKALLSPEQEGKWSKVERHRRREQYLKFGLVSGMSVDLVDALEKSKVDLAKSTELSEIADKYEVDLDRMLVEYKNYAEGEQKKMMDDPQAAMTKWQGFMKDIQDKGRSVRDLNRDFARKMSPLLSDEARATFTNEINRRSFPKVYKPSYTTQAIAAAAAFPDLDAVQKESVNELKTRYEKDLTVKNEAWSRAIEAQEEKVGGKLSVMMTAWQGGAEGKEAVTEARKARKELDESSLDKLKELLKEEQRNKLPTKTVEKTQGNGWFDWQGEFGVETEEE